MANRPEFTSETAGAAAVKANASVRARHEKAGRRQLMREISAQHALTPNMTVAELLKQRDLIDKALPPQTLSGMNLEAEMLLQYHTLRELQTDVLGETDVPANQKAQVANSVTSSLNKLTELQAWIYTIERFKMIALQVTDSK